MIFRDHKITGSEGGFMVSQKTPELKTSEPSGALWLDDLQNVMYISDGEHWRILINDKDNGRI